MKKQTKNFIFDLLVRELESEYIQANGIDNPLDIDYVKDLILASQDFINCFSGIEKNIFKTLIEEKIQKLINFDK